MYCNARYVLFCFIFHFWFCFYNSTSYNYQMMSKNNDGPFIVLISEPCTPSERVYEDYTHKKKNRILVMPPNDLNVCITSSHFVL